MRLALAIAPEHAQPSAFVVFRERLETGISKAAMLGYDAVELALAGVGEVDAVAIRHMLDETGIGVAAISTGRVFAERNAWLTSPDAHVRRRAIGIIEGLIEVAASLASPRVNIGRVRGFLHDDEAPESGMSRFVDAISECAEHAELADVDLVIEPVNRYELNFINSVAPDGLAAVRRIGHPRVRLMPDTFHMNIEDASITASLEAARGAIGYLQVADSNRWAPGQGHLDFRGLFATLEHIGYQGDVGVEILPMPSPDRAARQAIEYLRPLMAKPTGGPLAGASVVDR